MHLWNGVDCACSDHYSCETCAAYEACYWCSSSMKCEDYYEEKFSDIICPKKWVQHQSLCPASRNQQGLNFQSNASPVETLLGNNGVKQSENYLRHGENNEDLKDLLRKLLLLKLLRKIKSVGTSSLSSQETEMLNQLTNLRNGGVSVDPMPALTTTTTTTTTKATDISSEIKKLLSILQRNSNEKESVVATTALTMTSTKKKVTSKITGSIDNKTTTVLPFVNITSEKAKGKELLNGSLFLKKTNEQNAGVIYEEKKPLSLNKPTSKTSLATKLAVKSNTAKMNTVKPSKLINFCTIYEDIGVCNSDHNCTWCNTRDTCIRRSDNEYKGCVDASVNMKDDKYGLDRCLALKNCKKCVENNKCYWCDVSKSCHTYPFFGYVPQSCGGDWYVKQCDVQLAVIIIVLPLIIILLAMVTFYFCLKYCYYRRKILRVPLFEKPGVFDYRKDKKVYYVNPEDESSDTEMAVEKIRKKYRLPVEREPLIDPNS